MANDFNTLRKITAQIFNLTYQGNWSDDADLKERLVEEWIAEVRSKLISQAISKRKNISTVWLQTPIIQLDLYDKSFDPEIDSDCFILRSKLPLPRSIEGDDDNYILAVTDITNEKTFSKTNVFRSKTSKYSKFTGQSPKWYILNDFLYIINKNLMEECLVTGIFENPREVGRFMTQQLQAIWTEDTKYPMSLKMTEELINIVFQTKVLPFKQMTSDDRNDAEDNTTEGGGAQKAQRILANENKGK